MLDHFGLSRSVAEDPDLRRTWPKHKNAIRKADRVIEDYRRADGAIELRVVRRPR